MVQLLDEGARVPVAPPHGLEQVIATFGDIFAYVGEDHTLDPIWQINQLATIPLLFPIALSWDRSRQVERLTCHKLLRGRFEAVFLAIHEGGLRSKITSFGGCFSFRPQRNGTELSTHSWGIAIDLNPESNLQGECGEYGPRSRFHFPAIGVHVGRRVAGKSARSHALSVLHRILKAQVERESGIRHLTPFVCHALAGKLW